VVHRAMAAMLTGKDATDALLPRLKMPVLIVWGTEDRLLPLSLGGEDAPNCSSVGAGDHPWLRSFGSRPVRAANRSQTG